MLNTQNGRNICRVFYYYSLIDMSVFCLQMKQGNENIKCTICFNCIYNAISKKKKTPIVSKRLAKILKAFSAFSFWKDRSPSKLRVLKQLPLQIYNYITADGFNILKLLATVNGFSKRCNVPPARIRKTWGKNITEFWFEK